MISACACAPFSIMTLKLLLFLLFGMSMAADPTMIDRAWVSDAGAAATVLLAYTFHVDFARFLTQR